MALAGTIRIGSLGLHQAHVAVTGPLSDTLAFRLSAYDTDRNGYLKDVYDGRNLLSLHRQGVRGQLLYRPGADFSWRVNCRGLGMSATAPEPRCFTARGPRKAPIRPFCHTKPGPKISGLRP